MCGPHRVEYSGAWYRVMNRGGAAGEMGDALPSVNLGSGRTALEMKLGANPTCARLDNGSAKCWGFNSGQLAQAILREHIGITT